MRSTHLCLLFLVAILLGACSSTVNDPERVVLRTAQPVDPPPGSVMLSANTYAGDALAAMLQKRIEGNSAILVAAFTDMENTEASSPFGRTSMQQVSSRVGQYGYKIVEMRLGDTMRINNTHGELMLTRDIGRLLSQEHDAYAVLVGMYSRTPTNIYVSVRVVKLEDSSLLAAYEYYIPYADDSRYLLQSKGDNGYQSSEITTLWQKYGRRGVAFSPAPVNTPAKGSKSGAK